MTDKTDYIKREDAIKKYADELAFESVNVYGNKKDHTKDWLKYASKLFADIPSADVVERSIIDDIRLAEYANGLADGVNSEEHKQGQMIQEYIDAALRQKKQGFGNNGA